MAVESIHGIKLMVFLKEPVTVDFGYDGRCGDGQAQPVPFGNPFLRKVCRQAIGAIDEKVIGRVLQPLHGSEHGAKGSLENVDAVDGLGFHYADTHIFGTGEDRVAAGLTLARGKRLGIPNSSRNRPHREHNCSRNHRPSQRTSTDFIDPCDPLEAPAVNPLFKKERSLCRSFSGFSNH
jgi:hypothetical protein